MFEALQGIVHCPVVPIDQETDKIIFQGRELTLWAGGFAATTVRTEESARELIRQHSLFPFPQDYFQKPIVHDLVQVIVIRREYFDVMNEEDIEAMICHEYGHVLGEDSLRGFDPNGDKYAEIKLIVNLEDEQRADHFCAEMLGADRMLKALKANIEATTQIRMGHRNKFMQFLFKALHYGDKNISKRMQALAMMR